MSATFRIRQARLQDVPALLIFAHKLFSEKLPTIFMVPPPRLVDEEAFVRPYLDKPRWLLLIAEAEGIVVGVLNFKGFEHPQLQHGGEFGISVLRGWRGGGVGTKLLNRLASWARDNGFRRLELLVFANSFRQGERLSTKYSYTSQVDGLRPRKAGCS
jgi:GNAT superfamily N-acetyltransferase